MSCEFTHPHQCDGNCGDRTTVHTHRVTKPCAMNPWPSPDHCDCAPAKARTTALDDEIENDLGTAALQLLVSYACIAVVSFVLGLFVGQL